MLTTQEIVERGKALYEQSIRTKVETEDFGKYLSLDITSGDFEIDEDPLRAIKRLRERHPNADAFGLRIGYSAFGRIGGGRPTGKRA